MKCPHCGQDHPDDNDFCPRTGKKIEKEVQFLACSNPECRAFRRRILPPNSLFCLHCGKPIQYAGSGDDARSGDGGGENANNAASAIRSFTVNGVTFRMVRVEGGTFQMGDTSEQGDGAWDNEKPVHSVTLNDYMIGETEVTQELWEAVMKDNPSEFEGDQNPVENVSWNDCQKFIRDLNSLTGQHFRLPTEAEWEFAARGGNKSEHYKYSGSNNIDEVAWYLQNSGDEYLSATDDNWNIDWDKVSNNYCRPHPVGTKQANELGLYDMSGNVWEWCEDLYNGDYYSHSPQTNPKGPNQGVRDASDLFLFIHFSVTESHHVIRGGSWCDNARYCRVSNRNYGDTPGDVDGTLGFRLAL